MALIILSLFSPMMTLVLGVAGGGESFMILSSLGFSAEFWSMALRLPVLWVGVLMALMMRELMVLASRSSYWPLVFFQTFIVW